MNDLTIPSVINLMNFPQLSDNVSTINSKNKSYSEIFESVQNSNGVDSYKKKLSEKFGIRVTIESIPRDQHSLEKAGGRMGGRDVIIAPNIIQEMATDSTKANYYEGKIKYVFDNIPKYTREAAAMGLTFESYGIVIHEDGTVTHICGGGDPPERVAEVNRINAEKRKKKLEKIAMMNELLDEKLKIHIMNQKYIQNHQLLFAGF